MASIIYVDSPAGTGYSYADSVDDYITNDTKTVADLYEFILKVRMNSRSLSKFILNYLFHLTDIVFLVFLRVPRIPPKSTLCWSMFIQWGCGSFAGTRDG